MKVNAIVKVRSLGKIGKRVEVFAPRFKEGTPVISLHEMYKDLPVKLVTGWKDIPQDTPVTVNGSIIPDDQVGKCPLARGMFLSSFGDNTIYVVVPAILL